ncbi:MAG: right-handed parallel beta-helix repeat-containing protein [Kiritimatiellaeota bacterium]|nr:right-handed parallel beta-helix repeat-containing protein [Kiritimatiellota bacterium]
MPRNPAPVPQLYSNSVALGLAVGLCCSAATPQADFFVAPNGNDAWSGRLPAPEPKRRDGPFATLTRARNAVRELRRARPALDRPVTVLIRGGQYVLSAPLAFTPEDSGGPASPTIFAAFPGEKPVFSGGVDLGPWEITPDGMFQTRLPAAFANERLPTQLFVNGQRRTRARSPNTGYFRTDGPLNPLGDRNKARRNPETKMGFRFKPGDIREWPDWRNMNLVVFHSWTASIHWAAEISEKKHTLRFTAPSGWPIGWWENKQRYYIENVRAALDAPGEWIADAEAGTLLYIPLPGEKADTLRAVAPVSNQLVRFEGDARLGMPVEYIQLRSLTFLHSAWDLPRDKAHDGQAAVSEDAAIHLSGARNCLFEDIELAHVGAYGVWLAAGSKNNRFVRCHIHDLGAGGIKIGETRSPRDDAQAVEHNTVDNCLIHDGGHVFRAGVGVWIGRASWNRLVHNEICDFDYTGVSVGWSWGYAPSSANHNLVEYNHIHHVGNGVLSDLGGIYTLGVSPGTVLRGNVIHDSFAYSYGGWGLYTDEGSSNILMEKNIVYDTKSGGFHQHYGRENILRDNILAYSREAQVIRSREENHLSFTFERNIVVCDNGWVLGGNWKNGRFRLDRNLYWNDGQTPLTFAGRSFARWRKKTGQDAASRIANPGFLDAAKRDLRLRPNSPAQALGIDAPDPAQAGLYGPTEWTRRATALQHRTLDPEMRPPRTPPLSIQRRLLDDFESTPVGDRPRQAVVQVGKKGGAVAVTDELAADGKHCLKFTDAPGLEKPWLPYIHYTPRWDEGTALLTVDLRLEPGAVIWHEWRDNARPYNVGPSLRVTANGEVQHAGRVVARVPLDRWFQLKIECPLGSAAPGVFDLTVTVRGEAPQQVRGLPCGSPEWNELDWLGFVSQANRKTAFYLDNLKLELRDE